MHAVLVQHDPVAPVVLDAFVRPRAGQGLDALPSVDPVGALDAGFGAGFGAAPFGDAAPAFTSGDGATSDVSFESVFTLQYGAGAGVGADLFLEGEFGGLDLRSHVSSVPDAPAVPSAADYQPAIDDLLRICRERGFHDVDVVIGRWPDEVTYVELVVPSATVRKARSAPQRKQLLALLKEHHPGDVAAERVVFLPMTPSPSGEARYLAVVANAARPALEGETRAKSSPVWLPDAEMSLYRTVARLVLDRHPGADTAARQTTCIVRAGHENTLVLFFADGELAHVDVHPSLSAFDAPERLYRRVLFEQDKHGIDQVDAICVLAEANEATITSAFEGFFAEGHVTAVRDLLPARSTGLAEGGQVAEVIALGAALRTPGPTDRVAGRKPRPVGTSRSYTRLLPAMLVFVGALVTAGGFAYSSVQVEREIDAHRERLARPLPVSGPAMTKAHIDSLQAAYVAYTHAADQYDSLLVGNDGWSRVLEHISTASASVRGVWIESWRETGTEIKVVGNATSRDRVVALAERLGATIETLSFSEIRDWPVYAFTLRLPFERELPDVAVQLREQAEALARARHAQVAP